MCHAIEEKKYDKGVKSGKKNLNILTDVCISDVVLQFSNIMQPKYAAGFLIGNKDVASSLLNNLKKTSISLFLKQMHLRKKHQYSLSFFH